MAIRMQRREGEAPAEPRLLAPVLAAPVGDIHEVELQKPCGLEQELGSQWRRWLIASVTQLCWWLLALIPTGFAQTLHTVDSIDFDARLSSFATEKEWLFEVGGAERKVASSRLVRWGSWPGILRDQAVWLVEGSWICGAVRMEASANIVVSSDWLQSLSIPLKAVRGLVLTPPVTLSRWTELQSQMLAAEGEHDVLWLSDGRKLSGVIRWKAESSPTATERIQLDASGQLVELSVDEIQAIVFSPTLVGPLPERGSGFQVGLVDGSLLNAKSIIPSATHVGFALEGSWMLSSHDAPLEFAQGVAFLAGKPPEAIQLSQLAAASYRHLPDATLKWELGNDADVFGGHLRTSSGLLFQGLAMHSSSQAAYRWDGSPARLLSEVRLALPRPPANPNLGSANCQVMLAKSGALETVHQFTLRRDAEVDNTPAEIVDIDLTDARLIVLVTEKADFSQYADQVLWLDARIAKEPP